MTPTKSRRATNQLCATLLRKWCLIAIFLQANLVATDCIELSQREAYREASAVFRGTAVQVQVLNQKRSEPTLVTFKVDRGWKGPVVETMRVFAFGRLDMGTGYPFREGESYVVYVTKIDPLEDSEELRRRTGDAPVYGIGFWCRLRVRTDVEKESRILGKGRAPAADDTEH
jgi:hypothetical protein